MDFDKMRFSKEHEWVSFSDDSDIVYVELPEVGREIKFMESVGTIEAVKTVADLYTPISGVVKEVNEKLEDNPELVNESPYEDGWFMKVEMTKRAELDELMKHDEYNEMTGT